MLSPRTDTILRSIVGQYIAKAVPVPSQSLINEHGLEVSAATIRNEMARLERGGYITRRHPSAGSVPSDTGYRYYVESLEDIRLPLTHQHQISHTFHQVESKLEEWLTLTATLLSHLVHNIAVVVMPKPMKCQFKHLELVSLQDTTALLVLVIHGAKVRQQLVTFSQAVSQSELTAIASQLNAAYQGLTAPEISAKEIAVSDTASELADCIAQIMEAQVEEEHEEPYLDGLHFVLEQPEFADGRRMVTLVELAEQRNLLRSILPRRPAARGVQVIIGRENEAEAIQDFSVVSSQYGLAEEALGSIAIIGPTRMPYARSIAAIDYLSWLLSKLVARLYGREDAVGLYDAHGSRDEISREWTSGA